MTDRVKKYLLDLKIPALALLFFVFGIGVIMRRILSVLFEARALWTEESYAVEVCWYIYLALPVILGISLTLFAIVGMRAASLFQLNLCLISVASCIFALRSPEAIYAALCVFIGYVMAEKKQKEGMGNLSLFVPLPFIGYFFLLFCAGIWITSALESSTIWKFSGHTFSHTSFFRYVGLNLALSVAFALYTTIGTIIFLQVLLLVLYLARRYCRMSQDTAIFCFLLAQGLAFALVIHDLIMTMFEDEITVFSLGNYVPIMGILPVVFFIILIWVSLCSIASYTKITPSNLCEFYYHIVFALGLSLYIPLVRKRGKRIHLLVAMLFYMVASCILIYLNYPTISDYSASFRRLLSFMIICCTTAILFIVFHRLRLTLHRFLMAILVVLLLATIPVGLRFYKYQDVRMIVHEYSKVSSAQLYLVESMIDKCKPRGFGNNTTLEKIWGNLFGNRKFSFYPAAYRIFREPRLEVKTPPIFIFLLDALRPDHTNLMKYHRNITPHIEKLAREGVFFKNARSCATGTTCALRHIFTGCYSSRLMMKTAKVDPFWVEELIDAGYGTFLLNTFQNDYNGISLEAFYRNIPEHKKRKANFVHIDSYDEFDKVKETLKLLKKVIEDFETEADSRSGIFCYLHGCRTHIPWRPTRAIFGNSQEDRYDATIKEADEAVGIFIQGIKDLGLYENAIIIILADHGTGLMEHGRYGGFLNYEEQIRIPLLIRAPGCLPHVSEVLAQTIDIGPTLVDLVSDVKKNRFHGISLAGVLYGKPLPKEREYTFCLSSFEDLVSLKHGHYKFHYHRRNGYYKLYDLQNDPAETNNLADSNPDLVEDYLDILDGFLRAGSRTYNNPDHYRWKKRNKRNFLNMGD